MKPVRALGSPEVRLSLRAAFCMTTLLVLGLWSPARADSTVLALGALWAISQDGLDQWRVRGARLRSVALASVVGVALGSTYVALFPAKTSVLALYGVVAFLAGLLEASNYPSAGSYLAIGSIVGAGVGFSGRQFQAAVLIGAGALWVYVTAYVMDRRNARRNQRSILAQAYRSVADLFDAIGDEHFAQVRARTVAALDGAQDVIGSDDTTRSLTHDAADSDDELLALRQALVVALQCGEVVSLVAGRGVRVDRAIGPALRGVARRLETTGALDAVTQIGELRRETTAASDVTAAWRAALRAPDVSTLTRRTPFVSERNRLPPSDRVRFAALLTIAVEIATGLAMFRGGTHAFWLPLAVAFIFRPDLGSVAQRALARTVGTALGTLIAVAAAAVGNPVVLLIGLSCVMAAAVPWAARKSHALTVVAFTPIVFVVVSALRPDQNLFVPRVIDTGLAALIVLGVDFLLWSRAPSLRPRQLIDAARLAAHVYQRDATVEDVLRRHRLRRDALRAVASARNALASAQRDRRREFRHRDEHFTNELDEIEAAIDATTVDLLSSP